MWRFILRENIREIRARIAAETASETAAEAAAALRRQLAGFEAELAELDALSTPDLVRQVPALGVIAGRAIKDAMLLADAQFSLLQVVEPVSASLVILAQRNFRAPFLRHFATIGGAGVPEGPRVVGDTATDPDFVRHRDASLAEGVRALQITPLRTAQGRGIGVLTVHFGTPRSFTANDLDRMADHAMAVAEHLAAFLPAPQSPRP
jgi:GAF domain-containing protein